MARRPNILILMADQLAPAVLGAYGGAAPTPQIDALAARGVVFDNAYCNSPLCAPSRAVLLTGRLPSRIGAYDNAADFSVQTPTFAHYLRLAGYRTILAGKMHLCGADQLHGFEQRLTTDIYPADLDWTPDWTRPDERPDWYHTMDSVTQAGPCARTHQIDFDEEVVWAARQALFDIARGGDERPFCLVVSLTHPHDPFTIPDPWWSRVDPARVPPPAVQEPALDAHSRRLRHVIGLDALVPDAGQVQAARRAYYGAVSFVDDQFGAMLAALRATRLEDETIVIVLADHGEFLGEHGLWFKMSFLEPSCRIPLIVHAPGHFAARRAGEAVSGADLLPTLAELAGGGVPYATPLDGRSLVPHLSGLGGHDEAIGEYLAEGALAPMVMIRRETEKFIHTPSDPDQLFDLAADPHERRNLAPARPERTDSYLSEIGQRWDLPALEQEVLASQRRRRLVAAALGTGARAAWDFQPVRDAARMFVRNHMRLEDVEAMARFPRV
jgi:choline-sulfatase